MFHRKKIRLDVLKNTDNSSVKHFIQDQMGVILTIVGGIPIFFEYFGLISSPETIPDAALKAVSITSLLICTIIILFIYSERRQFIRERKIYTAALGLLLMIAGLVLLVIYTYEPSSSELVGKFESSTPYKLYLYHDKSSELLTAPRVPLEISAFWFMLSLMSFILWVILVVFLIFKIDSLIKKVNFSDPKPHFAMEDEELDAGTWLRPVKRVWIPVAQVMLIIFFTIVLFVIFEPLIFQTPLYEKITISVRKVNFIRTVAYVSYYPILVSGSMLMITVVFNSFERQRNFYENINQLSDPFFDEIDKITDSVTQFENWFNVRELESRERFLLNDHNRDEVARKAELDKLNSQESQRIFYWRTMRAKLMYYRLRIEEFAASEGRQLHASGPLIDDIFTKCMPKDNQSLREFKAVSSGDLTFWRRRGEEYLSWNIDMVSAGLKVTRIFVLNPRSPFHDFVDDDMKKDKSNAPRIGMDGESVTFQQTQTDESSINEVVVKEPQVSEERITLDVDADVFRLTEENISVLFKQVACGIRVYICFDHDLKASDGTKFGLNRQDFGVYPGFAVSFFGKPLRIGGRSLLMAFDQEIIDDFDEHYENILEKIKNQDCKRLDDRLTSEMEKLGSQHFVNNVDKRLDALEAFLTHHFESLSGLIKSVRKNIKQEPTANTSSSHEINNPNFGSLTSAHE